MEEDKQNQELPQEINGSFSDDDNEIKLNPKSISEVNKNLIHPLVSNYNYQMHVEERLFIVEKNIDNILLHLHNSKKEDE